jgi:hypothetical protein
MIQWLRNLLRSRWGWSFCGDDVVLPNGVLYEGEPAILQSSVRNHGIRIGTVYVRFQVWNPHRLFHGPKPWRFSDTGWHGGFEVVSSKTANVPITVFISYSWHPPEHKQWVKHLAEELRKYNIDIVSDWKDLRPGEEATLFMERGIIECKVTLLICSEAYTSKSNERKAGVGFETILSSHEYMNRTPEERTRMIPVVRDNSLPNGRKLPRYLGSAIYVDMSGPDWRAGPMISLVEAIRRHA